MLLAKSGVAHLEPCLSDLFVLRRAAASRVTLALQEAEMWLA